MPTGPRLADSGRHVIVVAGGDVPPRTALDAAWPDWAEAAEGVITADGGFVGARALGLVPTLLVGDLDSLDPALAADAERSGLPVHRSAVDKDESDTELALLDAVAMGVARVTVLGALGGGRLDHELANVWLLAHPAFAGVDVVLLDARSRVALVTAPGPDGRPVRRPLPGPTGGMVSLLPLGGPAAGITTTGLRYPLADEDLVVGPSRGLSNVRLSSDAAVTLQRGRLLVVESAG